MAEGIKVSIYAPNDLTTSIGIVARRWDPSGMEEHNRDGGGSFKIRIDDEAIADVPTLLDEGNIAKVTVDGKLVQLFEIKRKTIKIVPEGEYAGEWLEVSGTGPMEWFNHATVLPERGISQMVDDRVFNFTSAVGAWYNAADWTPAVSAGTIHYGGNVFPLKWPVGLHADWIWSQNGTAPVGDVFFRREFNTAAPGNYRMIATPDDYAVIYIDGVAILTMTDFDSIQNTHAKDFDLPAGDHVLAIRARNTGGSAGVVMAMCAVANNKKNEDLKDVERVLWTGDNLSLWKRNAYPAITPGWTLGQILTTLINEAKGRNVTSMQRLTLNFTATTDSAGVPWAKTYDFACEVGDTYRQIIERVSDSYADVWISPDLKLNVTQTRGVDRSVSVAGADPVIFRRGLNVLSAETETTAEIANVAFVKTNNGMLETAGPAGSISKYGRRESYLSAANSSQGTMTDALINQLFAKFAQPRMTPTLSITDGDGYTPWADFGVGDWILAPSDLDPLKLVKRRVMSIAVSEDSATGRPRYTCEIDSIQESYEERVNRWLQSIENGSKAGGISGTSNRSSTSGDMPAPGSGVSTPPITYNPDSRKPAAPTGVSVTPDIILSAQRRSVGKLSVYWSHSLLATDGTDLVPDAFEVWIRENNPANKYYILGSVSGIDRELYAEGLRVKTSTGTAVQYQVVVRAKSSLSNNMSDFSSPIVVTMIDDTTAPLKPSTPTVTVDRTAFKIKIDGKDFNGAAAAADYEYAIVETSATSGGTYVTTGSPIYGGAGEISVGGFGYGIRWFRVKHVDRAGNISVPSTAASATAVPLVDADVILSTIDAAATQITNAGNIVLQSGATLTTKLSQNDSAISQANTDIGNLQTNYSTQQGQITSLQTSVSGKNKIVRSTSDASGTTAYVNGDRWEKWSTLSAGGKLLATWRFNGTAWLAELIDPVYIPQIDIGSGTFGNFDGGRMTVGSLKTSAFAVSDLVNFAPSPAESPGDWEMSGGMTIVSTGLDDVGMRFHQDTSASTGWARGPLMAVKPGQKLYGYGKIYRGTGTQNVYVRYYWYDATKSSVTATPYTVLPNGDFQGATGSVYDGAVTVPAGTAYARYTFAVSAGTGTVGLYSVDGFRQSSTVQIANGAVTANEINASSVGAAVGTFVQANVSNLVVTGVANMNSAVVEKFWAEVVRAHSITADMLNVGRGNNMISWNVKGIPSSFAPHTVASGATAQFMTDSFHSGKTSLYLTGATVPNSTMTTVFRYRSGYVADNGRADDFNVAPDQPMVLETWIRSGGSYTNGEPDVRLQVVYMNASGVQSSVVYSPLVNTDFTWQKISFEFTPPAGASSLYIQIQQNQPGGLRLDDPFMAPQLQASLISQGAIIAPHIVASEEMWAKVLSAHKIKAVEIDANDIGSDTGFIGVLRTNILTTDWVKAVNIDATNGITSRHTITGATLQTDAAASRGIKLQGGYLRAWNATGVETFAISGVTGNVVGTGLWRTGTAGNYAELSADSNGGLLRFWTGSGTARGSIYARDDAGGSRMTLTYQDIDNPASTIPLIAVWRDRVNLSYGSKRIQVWDNAGTEELLLDATGSKVTVRGNVDMRDGRTQYRYGTAAPLGYVGNRPESGTGADFEVRADQGGVRITGSDVTAFAVYNNTTASAANVNVDSGGVLRRVSSASRYKADQQLLTLDDELLLIPVKDWIDKASVKERRAMEDQPRPFIETDQQKYDALDLGRIPGVIAEDVERHKGKRFVIYGPDGRTESVMYDRLAVAQIAVLKRQLDETRNEVSELRLAMQS